jgi:transposase-like protein
VDDAVGMKASDAATGAGSAEVRWRALADEQRASGMSVKAFCAARGIAASSLFAWRRRLGSSSSAASAATTARTFVEVSASSNESPIDPIPASPPASSSSIELELRADGRRVLILRRDFDPALLREAIAVLEDKSR